MPARAQTSPPNGTPLLIWATLAYGAMKPLCDLGAGLSPNLVATLCEEFERIIGTPAA